MKKSSAFVIGLTALFVAGCEDSAPPRYLTVTPPAWSDDVRVVSVSKFEAHVEDASGAEIMISSAEKDIGNALTASQEDWDLSITDAQGVTCIWNSSEQLEVCRKPNPAYAQYQAKRAPL